MSSDGVVEVLQAHKLAPWSLPGRWECAVECGAAGVDQPGMSHADHVAELIRAAGAAEIPTIDATMITDGLLNLTPEEVFVAVGVGTSDDPIESVVLGVFSNPEDADAVCRAESARLQALEGKDFETDHNVYYVQSGVLGAKFTGNARRVVGIGAYAEYLSKNGM